MNNGRDPRIYELPQDAKTKLRSTVILTSLPQIVSELVQNSLDAGARTISVGIDVENWSCWVRDDGYGISRSDLAVLGREQGRYGTSKSYEYGCTGNSEAFGFRGEALASAANLSCLEISSRTSKSAETYSIIVKGNKSLYSGPAVRWRRESPGTVVCIRDAFFNLPVRRQAHHSPTRTLEIIRQELITYALVFPEISLALENTNNTSERANANYIIRIPKTISTLATFRHIFGRAMTQHIEETNATKNSLTLQGFISLDGAQSKAYQYFYINKHPLAVSDFHRAIDSQFAYSSFGRNAYDETGEVPEYSSRRSPRKTEKKPVYVLNLGIPRHQVDNCMEPAKTVVQIENKNQVIEFLTSTIRAILERHGLVSSSSREGNMFRSLKRRRVLTDGDESSEEGCLTDEDDFETPPLWNTRIPIADSGLSVNGCTVYPNLHDDKAGHDEEIIWTDPNTGKVLRIDPRTGTSFTKAESHLRDEDGAPIDGRRRTFGLGVTDSRSHGTNMPQWIQNALQANDVFPLKDRDSQPLASNPTNPSDLLGNSSNEPFKPLTFTTKRISNDEVSRKHSAHQFTKEDLQTAQIIAQVDRKFIACLLNNSARSEGHAVASSSASGTKATLVLIDQHAADERVRVEKYLKQLCKGFLFNIAREDDTEMQGVLLQELDPPHGILLTSHEAQMLCESAVLIKFFRAWGVQFTNLIHVRHASEESENSSGYVQVEVSTVPQVVGEKLLKDGELQNLVKGVVGRSEELPSFNSFLREEAEEDSRWLSALRHIPKELLDLVNSKACRGAIMFNDTLTLSQCQKLVVDMSSTVFPFQCAHGRPSLVPLFGTENYPPRQTKIRIDWSTFRA